MLIYVAVETTDMPEPDLVLGSVAVREDDERAMASVAAERQADARLVEEVLRAGTVRLGLALARNAELAHLASVSRCFEGLYMRLRVLLESGLRPTGDWPSLFFRVPPEQLADAERGLEAAAGRYGEGKLVFVAADAPRSAGGRIAAGVTAIVAASYAGQPIPHPVSQLLWNGERPSGWVHYTSNRDCPCLGCRAARSAVLSA